VIGKYRGIMDIHVFTWVLIAVINVLYPSDAISDEAASQKAASESTLRRYKDDAKKAAQEVFESTISKMFESDIESSKSSELKKNMAHYQGENVENAGLDIKRANDQGAVRRGAGKNVNKARCGAENCELGSIFSSSAMMDREVKMDEAGFKRDEEGNIIDNKGYIDKAKKIAKNAATNFDFIKGEDVRCRDIEKLSKIRTMESCDQYYDVVHNTCPINQVVEIDQKYIYECSKKRDVKEKICEEKVIMDSVGCDDKSDCGYDAGGMVQGSIDGNIFWRANYPNLYLGTIDKVRDSGRCHIIDKNINFIVKNKDSIKEFRVTNIQYSDWIRISVNGVQAYNSMGGDGPYWRERSWHGGYGEFTNLHSGSVVRTCNTKRFYNTSPNVDLVPYLRDGNNTIRIELAFGNSGRLYVELRATQYCCNHWKKEKTEVKCRYVD